MLVFALLVIFIFNFALQLDVQARAAVTSGVLWVTFIFAGTLGLNRSMAVEKDRGCLDGLLLAPVDRSAIYFGKMLANLVFMLATAIIVLPVYSVLYNTNLFNGGLMLVILLGAEGYSAVGTLLDRGDYVSGIHNELAFALATESLLEVEVPRRAQWLRVLLGSPAGAGGGGGGV